MANGQNEHSPTMERKLFLSIASGLATVASAQLHYATDAPLCDHLREVNAEWRVMDPSPVGGDRITHFNSEAERIATHLHMVAERLAITNEAGRTTSATQARELLLSDLDRYADRGRFPQNQVLPNRNPVFIDPVGTACAVGQLMIESGHADLALRIRDEMNLAYVHDMKRNDVDTWAVAHGFTENELAWIQPAYAPQLPWNPMGGGTNGPVTELLHLGNDEMLVAGQFTDAGGTACTRVARWNGSSYIAMGTPVEGEINTAIEFDGQIHLGGSFLGGSHDLLTWNGSAWTTTAIFSSKYAVVTDLHIHNGVLHAAGTTSGFAGFSHEVKRLVNGNWQNVGQQLNNTIHALGTFNGELVCGGAFSDNFMAGDSSIMHIARLNNNSWEQLADGLNGTVHDVLVHQGALYAAGDCVAEVSIYFGMARIAAGASQWEQLMPNLSNYMFSPLDGMTTINCLLEHEGRIYFGGDFYYAADLMEYGRGIAVFNGLPDDIDPMGDFFGPVYDLELRAGSELVAAGASEPWANVAVLDLAMSMPDLGALALPGVWPNPVVDQLQVRITGDLSTQARLEVLDAAGKVVLPSLPARSNVSIDTHTLAAGPYALRITDGERSRAVRFVK